MKLLSSLLQHSTYRSTQASHHPAALCYLNVKNKNVSYNGNELFKARFEINPGQLDDIFKWRRSCSLYLNSKCIREFHSALKHICIFCYLLYCVWTVHAHILFVYNLGFKSEHTKFLFAETEPWLKHTKIFYAIKYDSDIFSKIIFSLLRIAQHSPILNNCFEFGLFH